MERPSREDNVQGLLEMILEPNFRLQNDTYFAKFLSHLTSADDKEVHLLLKSPILVNWIVSALDKWEATTSPPSLPISSFYLNLISLLSKSESIFILYHSCNVYGRVIDLFSLQSSVNDASIKLGYIRILTSFLNHQSGLEWMSGHNHWQECFHYCLQKETLYVVKEALDFVYRLIASSADEARFCRVIVDLIYVKFDDFLASENFESADRDGDKYEDESAPVLKLIIYVLENLMKNEHKKEDYRAVGLLLEGDVLENAVTNLKQLTHEKELKHDLYSIQIYIKIFKLLSLGKATPYEEHYRVGGEVMALINELFYVKYIPIVIRLAHLADSLWNNVPEMKPTRPPPLAYGQREPLRFQNQLLIFEITAIFGICFLHINSYHIDEGDDLREDFITSFFRMLHEKTIRMGYTWRNLLYQQPEGFGMAKFAAEHILMSIDNYNKSRAIMVFQVLLYMFKDILDGLKTKPDLVDLFVQNWSFMIILFQSMSACINKFEISWTDSVETICVMNCAIECVNLPFWPPRVIVHALKLVDLSIAKFLAPDLALLVEEDSTNNMLGSMLIAKLHDVSWEIRDSTLEILHTIAKISNSKYPLFQTMLLSVEIIPMVVTMALNDGERYVRAAAIKCLQEMIQVHEIWTKMLVNQDLPRKMMNILKNESEGIVRAEAAKLMANIHEYQFFQNDLMPEIYESMAIAAARDHFWEVKQNALDFWGKVILNHLQEQGYIDHKFPNVTFSKEKRKIVTLTEEEVQRRLSKVLQQLSDIGCLGVIVNAIREECDILVSKKAVDKVNKFKNILSMYNVYECYNPRPDAASNATAASAPLVDIARTDVLVQDSLWEFAKREEAPATDASEPAQVRHELQAITPEIFISFVQRDLDAMVNSRSDWLVQLDSFDSLVDDMRRSYDNNVNTMDCY